MKKKLSILIIFTLFFLLILPCGAESKEKYLLIGDSIAVGTGTLNPELYRYGRIVADEMCFEEINLAVNGYTTSDLLNLVNDSSNSENISNADYIQISVGGNNYLHSNPASLIASALRGDYSGAETITENALDELQSIINKIRSLNPDAVILLQTLYNPYTAVNKKAVSKVLELLNDGIENIAANDGNAYVVDVCSAFDSESGVIADDTIHPNENGHRIIADITEETINNIGSSAESDFNPAIIVIVLTAMIIIIISVKKITGKP